jgi:hypothetical protein
MIERVRTMQRPTQVAPGWVVAMGRLGEMLVYVSFALMIWDWLAVVILAWIWGGFFVVNMMLTEVSLSRYPEWAEYKRRTWWLVPPLA